MTSAAGGSARDRPKTLHSYPAELTPISTSIAHCGLDSTCANALKYLGDNIVLTSGGKFILFLNVQTGAVESQEVQKGGAVGAVTVHPSRRYYIVGERRPEHPLIQVYTWPSKAPAQSFHGGADVGYSALCCNRDGSRLASVASAPDFTLAIWDWAGASLLLRSKCFGTDVYSVAFSSFDDSLLVSGGAGHLKCWAMADTFTGKKLQGTLAKFGRHEISDVDAFVVLADGCVLSGSECGDILLWEGDGIACTFAKSFVVDEGGANGVGQTPHDVVTCHQGTIHHISVQGDFVVTAGDDGYMRYWKLAELESASGTGLPPYYSPQCVHEVCVGATFRIRCAVLDEEHRQWILQDAYGSIATLRSPLAGGDQLSSVDEAAQVCFRQNGAPLTSMALSPVRQIAFTGGEDGVLRCYDYVNCMERCRLEWPRRQSGLPVAVSAIKVLPSVASAAEDGCQATCVVVGFADGVLRLVQTDSENCTSMWVTGQMKAHPDGLCAVAVNEDGSRVASVSPAGQVFFFAVDAAKAELSPIGYCVAPLASPTCVEWDTHARGANGGCLLGYRGGELLSVLAPTSDSVDHDAGFEFPCEYDLVAIRQQKLPPPKTEAEEMEMVGESVDVLQEEDTGPWPIVFVVHLAGEKGGIAVGMGKAELAYQYLGTIRYPNQLTLPPLPPTGVEPPNYVEDPLLNLCYRDCVPQSAYTSSSGAVVICTEGNKLLLREPGSWGEVALLGTAHDSTRSSVTGAFLSHDGCVVVTVGSDGLLVSQLREGHTAPPPLPPVSSAAPATTAASVLFGIPTEHAAEEAPVLSVQEQKEADDATAAAVLKATRLEEFLKTLDVVRGNYDALLERNAQLPAPLRLRADELELDPDMQAALDAERARRVSDVAKEFVLGAAREDKKTEKLRNRFTSNLLCERFQLFAMGKDFSVASFRLRDSRESVARLVATVEQLENSDGEPDSEEDEGNMDEAAHGYQLPHIAEDSAARPTLLSTTISAQAALRTATAEVVSASVKQQLEKADARRRERRERRAGYEELLACKPDPAAEDTSLSRQHAIDTQRRGDCVFRTDASYRGSYAFRPTAAGKLQRILHYIGEIERRKTAFNMDLKRLREEKRATLQQLHEMQVSHAQACAQLGMPAPTDTEVVALTEEEEPEALYEMTREKLEAYSKQRAEERAKAEEDKKAQRGFGADLAGAQVRDQQRDSPSAVSGSPRSSSLLSGQKRPTKGGPRGSASMDRGSRQSMMAAIAMRERMDADLKTKLQHIKLTPEEKEERDMETALMGRNVGQLETSMAAIRARFNDNLEALRLRRAAVDADVCAARGRLTVLFREYQLMLVFRSQDHKLKSALETVKREREEVHNAIAAQRQSVSASEEQIRHLTAQLKSTNQAAEAYLEEHSPPERLIYLKKVYYRQLKRQRRGEDLEDDDDVTSDDEEEEEADDLGEEVRPPTCSEETWDRMLAFREARLDAAEACDATRAEIAATQKKLEKGERSVKQLEEGVKMCKSEIQALEAQKRKELNMLNAIVPMRLGQVRCLDPHARVPAKIHDEPVVVINNAQMTGLRQRIYDLADEKEQRRESLESMAAELQRMKSGRDTARRLHQGWEEKVSEVMFLKFGLLVDLEMLEACGSTWAIEAKKEELRLLELKWARAIRKMENQVTDLRVQLQGKVFENTGLLQDLGDLESERQHVDQLLTQATVKTAQKYRGSCVASKEERSVLRDLIAAQQEEMDALNAEILMLKRKGGHVYSPGRM